MRFRSYDLNLGGEGRGLHPAYHAWCCRYAGVLQIFKRLMTVCPTVDAMENLVGYLKDSQPGINALNTGLKALEGKNLLNLFVSFATNPTLQTQYKKDKFNEHLKFLQNLTESTTPARMKELYIVNCPRLVDSRALALKQVPPPPLAAAFPASSVR